MKKFTNTSLFDLSQDIAGQVPIDLVQSWAESNGDKDSADKILNKYKVRGTLVSSDTSGLSKISRERDLIETLKIVSDPKEIIYGLGRAIGGIGVGKWVADNTQMFCPENIELAHIVNAIYEANQKIINECEVKLGFCIHCGEFLNIGNGFYGEEADFMEEIAENYAEGGEVLITESVADIIKNHDGFSFQEKKLKIETPEKIFLLSGSKGASGLEIKEKDYPIYFDQIFFNYLKRLDEEGMIDRIYKEYEKKKIVVFIQKRGNIDGAGNVSLLDTLIENTVFSAILKKVNKEFDALEVKIAGSMAIYVFEIDEVSKVLDFSKKIRSELALDSLGSVIGIDGGEILLFPLEKDSWDIAGEPVNIASKQAQDFGKDNFIYATRKVLGQMNQEKFEEYSQEVSGILIEGFRL